MMLEEKIEILRCVARRFKTNRFEIDELVNEAWLRKNIREANDASYLSMAGKSAMIDYMRTNTGFKLKHRCYFHQHNLFEDGHQIIQPSSHDPSEVAFFDELNYTIRNFTRTQKLITKAILSGITMRSIGKIIGCSESNVSQIWSRLREILKVRYKCKYNEYLENQK
jgi:RNA polymerase sigma factor (sigma-70 family)